MRLQNFLHGLILASIVGRVVADVDVDEQQHKKAGNGDLESKLDSYDQAIKNWPDDFNAYIKRAALYLSLGRDAKALADFNKVAELKPDFTLAREQRAKLRIKMGRYDEALEDSTVINDEDRQMISKAQKTLIQARAHLEKKDYKTCVALSSAVLEISPQSSEARMIRADCRIGNNDYFEGVNDLQRAERLMGFEPELYVKSALVYYYLLDEYELAMGQLRRCLQYDQDDKQCKDAHKSIRKAHKPLGGLLKKKVKDWRKLFNELEQDGGLATQLENVQTALEQLHVSDNVSDSILIQHLYALQCEAAYKTKNFDPKFCESVVEKDVQEGDVPTMYDEAGLYKILVQANYLNDKEEYEQALQVLSNADQKWKPKLGDLYQTIQVNLKRSKSKDYYKVLDVPKTATDKEIKAAYRKISKVHHPDKAKAGEEEAAQKKMAEINEAYEVLSDKELRARYDMGDDPNDQSSGAGGAGGGFPGGGGGGFPGGFRGGFPGGFAGGFPNGGGSFRFNFRQG